MTSSYEDECSASVAFIDWKYRYSAVAAQIIYEADFISISYVRQNSSPAGVPTVHCSLLWVYLKLPPSIAWPSGIWLHYTEIGIQMSYPIYFDYLSGHIPIHDIVIQFENISIFPFQYSVDLIVFHFTVLLFELYPEFPPAILFRINLFVPFIF